MLYKLYIDFYQKPKLCTYASHKIDLLNEDDKYNPFGYKNKYASIESMINENLYENMVNLVVSQDLGHELIVIAQKSKELSDGMFFFLSKEMMKNKIEFKKNSKFYMQSLFVKMKFTANGSDVIMFFQALGITKKKEAIMTSLHLLKCITR